MSIRYFFQKHLRKYSSKLLNGLYKYSVFTPNGLLLVYCSITKNSMTQICNSVSVLQTEFRKCWDVFWIWIKWKLKEFQIAWANILFTIEQMFKIRNLKMLCTKWARFKFDACYRFQNSLKTSFSIHSAFQNMQAAHTVCTPIPSEMLAFKLNADNTLEGLPLL